MTWLFVAINAAVLLLIVWFGIKMLLPKKRGEMQMPPVPVSAVAVKTDTIYRYLDAVGVCRSVASVKIYPQIQGSAQLKAILFKQGDRVKVSQKLFELDNRTFVADRDNAAAKLEADKALLVVAKAQLERSMGLIAKEFLSKQEFDTYQANVKAGEASVKADEANLRKAAIQLEYCSITAPIGGIIGRFEIDQGNIVSSATLLTTIENTDALYIDFSLSENDFSLFRQVWDPAKPINIQVENKAEAPVVYFANTIDSTTGMFSLRGLLNNPTGVFWPGQTVDVRLLLQKIDKAFLVPEEALQINKNGNFVFVIQPDQTVTMQPIETGLSYEGGLVHVTKGLTADHSVVTKGQLALTQGSRVVVMPKKDETTPTH